MLNQFKEFLTKTNALALAIGVIIGAAAGKLVASVVDDVLMPIITMVAPGGDYKTMTIPLMNGKAILIGHLLGAIVDFLIIAWVVFMISKAFIKEEAAAPTKACPFCKETIPAEASRCKSCTSEVGAAA